MFNSITIYRTIGDIQSAIKPVVLVDLISWKLPYLMGDVFKLLVFKLYMLSINMQLTISSLLLMLAFRFLVLRPVDNVMGSHLKAFTNSKFSLEIPPSEQNDGEDKCYAGSSSVRVPEHDKFSEAVQQRGTTH